MAEFVHVNRRKWTLARMNLETVLKKVGKRFGAFITRSDFEWRRAEQMQRQMDNARDSIYLLARARET